MQTYSTFENLKKSIEYYSAYSLIRDYRDKWEKPEKFGLLAKSNGKPWKAFKQGK